MKSPRLRLVPSLKRRHVSKFMPTWYIHMHTTKQSMILLLDRRLSVCPAVAVAQQTWAQLQLGQRHHSPRALSSRDL